MSAEEHQNNSLDSDIKNIEKSDHHNLNSWVHAIIVVTFDIEIGQSVEVINFIVHRQLDAFSY